MKSRGVLSGMWGSARYAQRASFLVLVILLELLSHASQMACSLLSPRVAVAHAPSSILAALVTSAPPNVTASPQPVYGTLAHTPLNGVYCIDSINGIVYTGSNVLHVLQIRYAAAEEAEGIDGETNSSALSYFFTPIDVIYLDGWATGCVFANRYELFIAVTHVPTGDADSGSDSSVSASGPSSSAASPSSAPPAASHSYVVVNRQLYRATTVVFTPGMSSNATEGPVDTDVLLWGGAVVLRRQRPTADPDTRRVATPLFSGFVCIDNFRSPLVTSQYIEVTGKPAIMAIAEAAEGQSDLASLTDLYAFEQVNSTVDGQLQVGWEIEGLALPPINEDSSTAPVSLLDAKERFQQCYASALSRVCGDCAFLAMSSSSYGLLVAWESAEANSTLLFLLAAGTACTAASGQGLQVQMELTGGTPMSRTSFTDPDSGVEADAGDGTLTVSLGTRSVTALQEMMQQEIVVEQDASSSSSSETAEVLVRPHLPYVQLTAGLCKVPAMVVDSYGSQSLYVALECPRAASAGGGNEEAWRTVKKVARVDLEALSWGIAQTVAEVPILPSGPTTAEDVDEGTDETLALELSNATRLLYLSVRRRDASVRVFTLAAFGVSSVYPDVVDARGSVDITLSGYGLVPGMRCVFSASDDATAPATFVNASAVSCIVPTLLAEVCDYHLVSLMLEETEVYAVPAPTAHRAVVSPVSVPLLYTPSPIVESAVDAATGLSRVRVGTSVTLLVRGRNFVNATAYNLPSYCVLYDSSVTGVTTAAAAITFLNSTALLCDFDTLPLLGSYTMVYVSTDGSTASTTSAFFTVYGPPAGVSVATSASTTGDGGTVVTIDSYTLTRTVFAVNALSLRSSAAVALPTQVVWLSDSRGSTVAPPSDFGDLYAYFSFAGHRAIVAENSVVDTSDEWDDNVSLAYEGIQGTLMRKFEANGAATFDDIILNCPRVGFTRFSVIVGTAEEVLESIEVGNLTISVTEGDPYTPAFVASPSRTYYPDAPVLQNTAVIGVADACGNVYRYLNDSVLTGGITVQLFGATTDLNSNTQVEALVIDTSAPTWTVAKPVDNLFFIDNISMASLNFNVRYYVNVSANLPQPSVTSWSIEALPCGRDRWSVAVFAIDEDESASVARSRLTCAKCLTHGVCNGTGTVLAADGYWRSSKAATAFTSCRVGYGMSEACADDGQCTAGYVGVLCGECERGYHTMGRACRKCLPRTAQGVVVAAVLLCMVLVLAGCVVLMTLVPPSSLVVLAGRSVVLTVQITSLFMFIAVPWPKELETLFNGLYAAAEFVETVMTCFLSPSAYLVFTACTPFVLVPLVAAIAGVFLRLGRWHRVDSYRVHAMVITALLHCKQERFHRLRHILAHEMRRQGGAGSVSGPYHGLASYSASATRLSLSEEWRAVERGAAAGAARGGWSVMPGAQSLTLSQPTALPTAAPSAAATLRPPASPRSMASMSVYEAAEGDRLENYVLDAFTRQTASVVARLAAAKPEATWEEVVVAALREDNAELAAAVQKMQLPLLTRERLRRWAGHTTSILIKVPCIPVQSAQRAEAPMPFSSTSIASTAEMMATQRPPGPTAQLPARGQADDAAAASAPAHSASEVVEGEQVVTATTVSWKRVGMLAVYRDLAVQQYRASWPALFMSTGALVLTCYYIAMVQSGALWMRCITVPVLEGSDAGAILLSATGNNVRCNTAEYRALRALGVVMFSVYGFGAPLAVLLLSLWLGRRYGQDVVYAAFPVVFFGDSVFDYIISISDIVTKLVAVVVVTWMDAPMLQSGVLAVLYEITLFVNSMWNVTGQSVMARVGQLVVTLRGVLIMSRVVFLLVCHLLFLLVYLIISDYHFSSAGERGFVSVIALGIGLVFALFAAVAMHAGVRQVHYLRHRSTTAAQSAAEEQRVLTTLLRRYYDMCHTIELYLKVCERGFSAAQKLDALSSLARGADDDAATLAGEHRRSSSSLDDAAGEGDGGHTTTHNTHQGSEAPLSLSATGSSGDEESSSDSSDTPQALTYFSAYPQLPPREGTAQSAEAVGPRRRRNDAKHLSSAFRLSLAPLAPSAAADAVKPAKGVAGGAGVAALEPLCGVHYPDSADLVQPVEGNANWVCSPRPRPATTAAAPHSGPAEGRDEASAAAPANNGGGAERCVVADGDGFAAAAAAGAEPEALFSGAAAGATDVAGVVASAAAEKDRDAGADGGRSLRRSSSEFWSSDYAHVACPTSQPRLRRGDSLLLSIRGLHADHGAEAQRTRDELVANSNAVAMTEYLTEQHLLPAPHARGGHVDSSAKLRETAAQVFLRPRVLTEAARVASAKTPSSSGPPLDDGITIDSCLPLVDLDLASSFDPMAVPPLPVTRAVSRLRPGLAAPKTSCTAANTASRDPPPSLLADLQRDMERELQDLHDMPVRDSILDMDLDQLLAGPSVVQQDRHQQQPVSLWSGTAAAALGMDTTQPLSPAGRTRGSAGGRGGETPLAANRSGTGNRAEANSGTPLSSGNGVRSSSESPVPYWTGVVSATSPRKGDHSPLAVDSTGHGSRSADPQSPVEVPPPPLPQFVFPERMARHTHRTAAEYLRKRSARHHRGARSRSGGSNVPRSRPKSAGVTAASRHPHESRKPEVVEAKARDTEDKNRKVARE